MRYSNIPLRNHGSGPWFSLMCHTKLPWNPSENKQAASLYKDVHHCVCLYVCVWVFFGGGWGMNGWGRWGGVCLYASQSIMHNTNLCIWSSSCWNAQWSGYLHSFFPLRCLWFLLQCVLLPISVPLWCVNQNQKEHWWETSHWWLKSQGIYCHPTVSISLSLTLLLVIFFTSSHF